VQAAFPDRQTPEAEDPDGQRGARQADTFLGRVAEATRVRFPAAAVTEQHGDGCEYLRVTQPLEAGGAELRPVGVIDGPVTQASLSAFAAIHAQFAAADPQVRSELVHGGTPASADLIAVARRLGFRLRTFVDYQGLLDLSPLAEAQRKRIDEDPVYPAMLYVEQRFRVANAVGSGYGDVEPGLVARAIEWLSADGARLIVVLGDFGRGKTSFLRQLTRRLSTELPGVLPVLVELRTLEKAPTLDELLAQHPPTASTSPPHRARRPGSGIRLP